MEIVKMTNNGRITIPASIRRKLGLNDGDKLIIDVERRLLYLESATATVFGKTAGDIVVMAAKKETGASLRPFRRTGLARGLIDLPDDFDEHFNDMDAEIATMFYGEET